MAGTYSFHQKMSSQIYCEQEGVSMIAAVLLLGTLCFQWKAERKEEFIMLNPNVRPLDLQWCVYCRHVESESAWDCFKLLTYFCITMWLNIISSSQDSSNVLLKSLFRTFIMSSFSFYSWQWIVGKQTLWKSTWGPLWTGWIVGLKRLPANAPTKSASRVGSSEHLDSAPTFGVI